MPTTVTSTIKKTAGDYSSAQAWEDASPANLVTDDKIWKGEMYGVNDEWTITGDWLTITGSTVDSTRYKWLTAAAGESFADHASKLTNALRYNAVNGVAISGENSNYSGVLRITENYALVERLQMKGRGTGSGWNGTFDFDNTGAMLRGCIIEKVSTAGSTDFMKWGAGTTKLVNCLVRLPTDINASTIRVSNYISSGAGLHNCTIVKDSTLTDQGYGVRVGVTGFLVKNCAVFGPQDCFNGTFDASGNYNATDDADAPGANSQQSKTYASQFEDVDGADADFRVKTGADLIGNGTRDQTYTSDLDIVGQSRSTTTPTIGAWEVVAGGASAEGGGMLLGSRRNRLTIP